MPRLAPLGAMVLLFADRRNVMLEGSAGKTESFALGSHGARAVERRIYVGIRPLSKTILVH